MIARKFISAAVASFSGLSPDSMSAVQHKRIPHFASQSDNPASLFLFFVLAVNCFFLGKQSCKFFIQIFYFRNFPIRKFGKCFLCYLVKNDFITMRLIEFFAVTEFSIRDVCISGLCIIDNMSFKDLVLYHLFLCIFDGFH